MHESTFPTYITKLESACLALGVLKHNIILQKQVIEQSLYTNHLVSHVTESLISAYNNVKIGSGDQWEKTFDSESEDGLWTLFYFIVK